MLDRLDHQWLNEFPPFDVINPSAENMAKYIYDEVTAGCRGAKECESGRCKPVGNRHRERDLPAV